MLYHEQGKPLQPLRAKRWDSAGEHAFGAAQVKERHPGSFKSMCECRINTFLRPWIFCSGDGLPRFQKALLAGQVHSEISLDDLNFRPSGAFMQTGHILKSFRVLIARVSADGKEIAVKQFQSVKISCAAVLSARDRYDMPHVFARDKWGNMGVPKHYATPKSNMMGSVLFSLFILPSPARCSCSRAPAYYPQHPKKKGDPHQCEPPFVWGHSSPSYGVTSSTL